jgi:ankyrin repeat protein
MAFNSICSSAHDDAEEYKIYPLHLAAKHSQSVELLQILLQLDKSVTKKKSASYDEIPHTPLGILCTEEESPVVRDMILCLIKVDSSVEVIEDAIRSCLIDGYIGRYTLTLIELLLKANPEAAKCQNVGIMHEICRHTNGDLFMSLMSLFLALNKDVLKKTDTDGDLPIHIATKYQDLAHIEYLLSNYPESVSIANNKGELPIHFAMQNKDMAVIDYFLRINPESTSKSNMKGEFPLHFAVQHHSLALIDRLLKMYPEAASMITPRGMNILHYVVDRLDEAAVDIATFIFTRFPNLIHERNGPIPIDAYERNSDGYTPFLLALANSNFKVVTALCQIDEQVIRDVVICTEVNPCTNLSNSLHIMTREFGGNSKPVSEGADCFRLLISLYPEAAGIDNQDGKTPYEYARHNGESSYMLRLLLRAAPAINPDELHRLNYAERRQAMFLAFRAIVSSSQVSIWRRLKMEDENLLRYVVCFL